MSSPKIAIVTDSSAYIPQEALGDLRIHVIPLWLLWDGESFRDGVDIQPAAFYQRLQNSKTFPSSSQPTPQEFTDFFRAVAAGGADAIVGMIVSSGVSATFTNAQAAQAQLPELDIRLVDSLSVSMGLGFIVLAAARAAAAGASVDEVVAAAEDMRDRVQLIFAVDTLEFLHRGGRIGGAKRLLGTALKIKPLLHFHGGQIEPLVQVRTKAKAIERMLEEVELRLGGKPIAEAAVLDVGTPAEGDAVARMVRERFGMDRVYRTPVSPVVGTHAGPGTVGIAFYAER